MSKPTACIAMLCAAGCVLLGFALHGQERASGADREPQRLRILSYNIHHGRGMDGKIDLSRIARVITELQPDLVALQEVDNKTSRSGGVDQAAQLGEITRMHAAFGKAIDYAGGQYGVAILSRRPILKHVNCPLPFSRGREPRTAFVAAVRPFKNGPKVLFIATHLDHTPDGVDRIAQAKKLNGLQDRKNSMLEILAGDLNATPPARTMSLLLEKWIDASAETPQPTFPAEDPRSRIDYVLFEPTKSWRAVESRAIDEKTASDHAPLFVVLEMTKATDPRK